ncbi:hypothetical protein ACHAWO_008561 [Cyclotella atomus]|uniref:Uncharacterized protein n=1 Tax=Cyclotella atomus TaxID=382360 RepID=A0ABD3PKS7_9STRA
MGGDDLSDDDYLLDSRSDPKGTAISSSHDDSVVKEQVGAAKKRKTGINKKENTDAAIIAPSSKKSKNNGAPASKSSLIIQAGRGIALDGPDAQATFFGTCYSHAVKMNVSAGEQPDERDEKTKKPEDFMFHPHHFHAPSKDSDASTNEKHHSNLSIYLKQSNVIPSMKRLKNWKHNHSPMVIIISLSARRCVELQKQLSSLNLPVAKLFAKHMNVDEQVKMLKGDKSSEKAGGGKGKKAGRCYGIGVGTPGRLLTLLRHGNDGTANSGALKLNHTELIIIDCHEDSKGFNVCTLRDTAKELMDFMKEGVVSELDRRKDKIKLALF